MLMILHTHNEIMICRSVATRSEDGMQTGNYFSLADLTRLEFSLAICADHLLGSED